MDKKRKMTHLMKTIVITKNPKRASEIYYNGIKDKSKIIVPNLNEVITDKEIIKFLCPNESDICGASCDFIIVDEVDIYSEDERKLMSEFVDIQRVENILRKNSND